MPSIYYLKSSIFKTVNLIIQQTCIGVDPEILACEIRALHLSVDQLGVDVNTVVEQIKKQKVNAFEKTLFDSDIVQD
jgi:hypothetical protein